MLRTNEKQIPWVILVAMAALAILGLIIEIEPTQHAVGHLLAVTALVAATPAIIYTIRELITRRRHKRLITLP
jgi:hypothetical protein